MTTNGLRRGTGALLAFLIAGCGLADYEQQMHATQDRVERFREESEVLGDPIAIPTMKEAPKEGAQTPPPPPPPKSKDGGKDQKGGKDAAKDPPKEKRVPVITYPFFLRLPRAIRPIADAEPRGELAFRYPKVGASGKPGDPAGAKAPDGAPSGFFEVYLAFGLEPSPIFVDKVTKLFPHSTEAVQASKKDVTVPEDKQPMTFDVREFNDGPTAWLVYSHTEGAYTVAIVYHVDKGQRASLDRAIELSLASLAMGTEANYVAGAYQLRSKQ